MAENGVIPVVSSRFCYPYTNDLKITKNLVKDADGNLIFQVDNNIIVDATGLPILTLRKKTRSMHNRWDVFRGESEDEKDVIFSAQRCSMLQRKDKIDVFLANNEFELCRDYKIQGFGGSCEIYAEDSTTVVAQMDEKTSVVRVYPNIDQAFIIALTIIFHAIINTPSAGPDAVVSGVVSGVVEAFVTVVFGS